MSKSNLLINESPLQVLPSLAVKIGLNEAIILQQIHYWIVNIKNAGFNQDGYKWVYNTYAEWQADNFPFWSERTIQRAFINLEKMNLILAIQPNKNKYDRTKYYRINYDQLNAIEDAKLALSKDAKLARSLITETTSETTTKIKSRKEREIDNRPAPQKEKGERKPTPLNGNGTTNYQPQFIEYGQVFEMIMTRQPLDLSEFIMWTNGGKGTARGFNHFLKIGITPAHMLKAADYCKAQGIAIKNPNTLFTFADSIRQGISLNGRNGRNEGTQRFTERVTKQKQDTAEERAALVARISAKRNGG